MGQMSPSSISDGEASMNTYTGCSPAASLQFDLVANDWVPLVALDGEPPVSAFPSAGECSDELPAFLRKQAE